MAVGGLGVERGRDREFEDATLLESQVIDNFQPSLCCRYILLCSYPSRFLFSPKIRIRGTVVMVVMGSTEVVVVWQKYEYQNLRREQLSVIYIPLSPHPNNPLLHTYIDLP